MAMDVSSAPEPAEASTYKPRYIDIGINLADPIFRGVYHGTHRHPDDLHAVIRRARDVGCVKLMVTGSDFQSARLALDLAQDYPGIIHTTAGIHPCSSAIFSIQGPSHKSDQATPDDPDPAEPVSEDWVPDTAKSANIIAELTQLLAEARSADKQHLVAMGEFGLDYDRLHYCSKALQLHSFAAQLKVAATMEPQLPLFLHSRAAHRDLVAMLKAAFGDRLEKLERGGVVHSFTGTVEEMRELMDLGLHIGVNGCSFKTAENCAVVKEIRLDRLMLETDGPWCEVRPSHEGYKYLLETRQEAQPCTDGAATPGTPRAQPPKGSKKHPKMASDLPERYRTVKKEKWEEGAMVKGRNEPCTIERVAAIVAAIKGLSVEEVCEAAWTNTNKVFRLDDVL